MAVNNVLKLRRGTESTWISTDPILSAGEPGYSSDVNRLKIGDGTNVWTALDYLNQESYSLVTTVYNNTGSIIPKMSAVYITGGHGDQPTVTLASASSESTSSKTYGVTAEAIGINQLGKVIVSGALTGLNTDQFNPTAPSGNVNGTSVWLSTTAGGLTTTVPTDPNHSVFIGTIIRTHQNEGIIEVKIQNGYELNELHNVSVDSVTTGQFLYYNGTSELWQPEPVLFSDGTNIGIGTITPSKKLDINGDVNIDGNLTFDSYTESVVANGNSGTSKTLSLASGTVHTCTLTGNCTFTMPTATAGKSFSLFLNSGVGNYTATFTGVRWADSATPTATITASKVDIYSFISDGTYWYGSFSQNYG